MAKQCCVKTPGCSDLQWRARHPSHLSDTSPLPGNHQQVCIAPAAPLLTGCSQPLRVCHKAFPVTSCFDFHTECFYELTECVPPPLMCFAAQDFQLELIPSLFNFLGQELTLQLLFYPFLQQILQQLSLYCIPSTLFKRRVLKHLKLSLIIVFWHLCTSSFIWNSTLFLLPLPWKMFLPFFSNMFHDYFHTEALRNLSLTQYLTVLLRIIIIIPGSSINSWVPCLACMESFAPESWSVWDLIYHPWKMSFSYLKEQNILGLMEKR